MEATAQGSESALLLDGLVRFVEQEIAPIESSLGKVFEDPRLHYTEDGREAIAVSEARREARQRSARAGYYAAFCPVEIGGAGLGPVEFFLAWEALHLRYGPGARLAYDVISHWASGPSAIWTLASPRLQKEVLPETMSGRWSGCFGMSEPGAGSDAWAMKTSAVRSGDDWLINGAKQWTSYSPHADYVLVFAVTDVERATNRKGGVGCFYLPTTTPGFNVDSVIRMFGETGGNEGILSFVDVRVPDDSLIGDGDHGFDLAMLGVTQGRLYNTARTVGLSRWALERSIEYSKSRATFGKPISEHQAIQMMLADIGIETYAARSMGLDFARKAAAGEDVRKEAAMAKYFATNTALRAFDRAMQVHGAMGFTNELGLFKGWHAARALRVADGTDEILKRTIARELIRGNVSL